MSPDDTVVWETQLRHFVSHQDQGFMLFQLGPFSSGDPERVAEKLLSLMQQMEAWGSFGQGIVTTHGNPANPHYVLAALRDKDYEDWLEDKKRKKDQYWWDRHFAELKAYVAEQGSADLRWIDTTTRERFWLGVWCMHQRRMYHAQKLKPDQVSLLESLPGLSWGSGECEW